MWNDMIKRINQYNPPSVLLPNSYQEAAVLIPILKKEQPELVLTLRADNLSTHSGEVAFPGGKREEQDRNLKQTALRETEEEIALKAPQVEVIGSLQTLVSKHQLKVKPYIGVVREPVSFHVNQQEIASVFTVPLSYFCNTPYTTIQRQEATGKVVDVPCYYYEDYKIWGLTAMMIVELINIIS